MNRYTISYVEPKDNRDNPPLRLRIAKPSGSFDLLIDLDSPTISVPLGSASYDEVLTVLKKLDELQDRGDFDSLAAIFYNDKTGNFDKQVSFATL